VGSREDAYLDPDQPLAVVPKVPVFHDSMIVHDPIGLHPMLGKRSAKKDNAGRVSLTGVGGDGFTIPMLNTYDTIRANWHFNNSP
jgi:hypothetical protein